ncbi:MAG: hypothetical protein WCK77_00965 [Verrucomicrobiota bacterium]
MKLRTRLFLTVLALLPAARAAITISGVADKTKYANSASFTVTADPSATTTTATLDGAPVAVGSSVLVTSVRYHELVAISRTAGNVLVSTKTVRFIVHDSTRNGTEDGIPQHTPLRTVNDAPSAFTGGSLQVIAPAAWPAGLPVPIAAILRASDNEPLWLNGTLSFGGLPATPLQLRRGWGSGTAPAASAGAYQLDARVGVLSANPTLVIEAAPVFTNVSGIISANTSWPANSRVYLTGTLTINAGATLTIGAGSIVKIYGGSGTAGSAAEIVVYGALVINGAAGNPVVLAPDTATGHWGGIELPATTSNVTAQQTIFTGSGEDQTWFTTHTGYTTHKPQQALFLVAGSGSGTAVGAQLHLTECYAFSLAGQMMNSKTNTSIELNRCLMQRAVTGGELSGCKLAIDRSAVIEFPSEDATFNDGDEDALYLTNGDLSITNTVIGFTKDDGVDSGGTGGDNPFTAAADLTPFVSTNNWFEGTYHEGNSLSGTRNVTHTSCVFVNCGQGVEDGYSASATGDGPNALVDACLFAGNMVGVRWGDNYGSGYAYNGSMEVKNSFMLNSLYKDAFSGQWDAAAANGWIYQTMAANTFGHAYFNLHDNHISQPDPLNHPSNTTWNPVAQGALIEPYMPVPGSAVGVAICSYAAAQADTAAFPGSFTVRLNSFSSRPVSVTWAVIGKTSANSNAESTLATGTLNFAPGEMSQTIAPVVASPGNQALIRVALSNPVNAEVTGEAWYCKPPATAPPTLVASAASGWRYRETRSEPPATWKTLAFDDSSAAATEWLPCTLPAGFATGTAFSPAVTWGTTVGYGVSADRTKAYYFRKKFTIAEPTQVASLTFNIRRDDGAVVWLNNDATATVVSADGTFAAPYAYSNLAPNATNVSTYLTYTIPSSKLVAGENILAVEVHQSSVTSSDLLLDCELLATFNSPLALNFTSLGAQPVLYWFDSAATLEESTDLATWTASAGATSPVPFNPAVPRKFFRLGK